MRRSTEEHQMESLAVQEADARRFAKSIGAEVTNRVEATVSRAEFIKRPDLTRVLDAARRREFDVLITRDDSRLGGDMLRTALFVDELLATGVRLYFYSGGGEEVTLEDATDKISLMIRTFASASEREKISSRTHDNLLNKARRGLVAGGIVYGYVNRRGTDGVTREIDQDQARIVRLIFDLAKDGLGLRGIAKELNSRAIPSPRAGRRGQRFESAVTAGS